jgi:regulator of protease activity HflC (stomatin/prohibitin superfamily)
MIIDVRVRTEAIPPQDIISRDNVSVKVNAVVYYRVVEPSFAVNRVEDFAQATSQLAQTTLRAVLGKHELDDILSKRDQLNHDIQEILDAQTESWGVKVTDVAIKDVDIDPSMIRAIARQAEAERERRAKIINAEGELQAAQQLDEAAQILARRPETMQLRYLGTLNEFTNAKGSTVVLPMPLDLLATVLGKK